MPAAHRGDDLVGIGCPYEGLGLLIVLVEEAVDGGLKVGDGSKDAALQSALCEGCEEALDGVEPRGGRWREMERPAWVAVEPLRTLGCL